MHIGFVVAFVFVVVFMFIFLFTCALTYLQLLAPASVYVPVYVPVYVHVDVCIVHIYIYPPTPLAGAAPVLSREVASREVGILPLPGHYPHLACIS